MPLYVDDPRTSSSSTTPNQRRRTGTWLAAATSLWPRRLRACGRLPTISSCQALCHYSPQCPTAPT
jgi:hypothetical protein